MDRPAFISHVYERFNARDMETVLAGAWAMVDPRVDPIGFSEGPNGQTVVRVHQVVRDLSGSLLLDHEVSHIFSMEDGLIRRFDIGED